jgi:hypothetical protein
LGKQHKSQMDKQTEDARRQTQAQVGEDYGQQGENHQIEATVPDQPTSHKGDHCHRVAHRQESNEPDPMGNSAKKSQEEQKDVEGAEQRCRRAPLRIANCLHGGENDHRRRGNCQHAQENPQRADLPGLKFGYLALPLGIGHPMCLRYRVSRIAYRLSLIAYRLSLIAYRLSLIAYRVSPIAYRISPIAYRLSRIAYRLSHIAYRVSRIASHVSRFTFHVSRFTFHASRISRLSRYRVPSSA